SQVASGGYNTFTRTIFLMNPKNYGKAATINDFSYGCKALPQCFDPMFIRRLDLAVFTKSEHEYDFYNKTHEPPKRNRELLQARHLRNLIFWAWTRKPDDIIWEKEAVDECLKRSTEVSKVYGHSDDVPLVS